MRLGVALGLTVILVVGGSLVAAQGTSKVKSLELRAPKEVLVGQPFRVSVRNLRAGAVAAFDAQEVTLGRVKADASGTAALTSSLWREQTTPLTVTEIVRGRRARKVVGKIKVLAGASANSCRPQDAAIRVWALGDSLTVGGYGDATGFTDSYRYSLFRALRREGITDVVFRGHIGASGQGWGAIQVVEAPGEFSHSGLGGYTVSMIDNELDTIAAVALPDVVILNLGTNGGTPAEYRELIAHLQRIAPRAVVVMGTLTPRVTELQSRKALGARAELNFAISALGNASTTDRLYTADVFNKMLGDTATPLTTGDFADETHLSISGGTRFGLALLPEVRAAINAFRINPCG